MYVILLGIFEYIFKLNVLFTSYQFKVYIFTVSVLNEKIYFLKVFFNSDFILYHYTKKYS